MALVRNTTTENKDTAQIHFHIRRIETDLEKLKSIVDPNGEKAQIDSISSDLSDSGKILQDIGTLMGGKDGGKIMKVGAAVAHIGMSLSAFGPGVSALTMAGGITGITVGVFSIAMALFDDSDDGISAHQQIMEALYALAQMMERGFNLILEKQAFLSWQVSQLSSQVTRIEKLLGVTAKESYLKEFLTLVIKLNHYLYEKGVTASRADILMDLRNLESWIAFEGHAYKPTVTGTMLISDEIDPRFHLSILTHPDFDNIGMLSYLANLLQRFTHHRFSPEMKASLPNVRILQEASVLYRNVVEKLNPDGNIGSVFESLSAQWKSVSEFLNSLRKNSGVWDGLFDQINSYSRQATQFIAYLESAGKFSKPEGTIADVLSEGSDKTKLMLMLDFLEIRRVLMIRFCEIFGNPDVLADKIKELPSKTAILSRTRASLKEANQQLYAAAQKGDPEGVKKALEAGANHALIIQYPTNLVGEAKQSEFVRKKNSLEILNLLAQYASHYHPLPLDTFFQNWPQSYYSSVPIQVSIWRGCFEQIILLMAQGFETSTSTTRRIASSIFVRGDFYLRDRYGAANSIKDKILVAVMNDINNPKGILYKDDLRHGYNIYRAAQDDNQGEITRLLSIKQIQPHILLWLTVLIGDLKPVNTLKLRSIIISAEDGLKGIAFDGTKLFLPIHLAVQLGRGNIIHYLKEAYVGVHFKIIYDEIREPISNKRLIDVADEEGFSDTAYELYYNGLWPNVTEHNNQHYRKLHDRLFNLPDPFNTSLKHQESPQPFTVPEGKRQLTTVTNTLSDNFTVASKRFKTKAGTVDPKFLKLVSDRKYAEATQYMISTLTPMKMTSERASAYIRGFARHDFVGVIIAKINSKNEPLNKQLQENIPIALKNTGVEMTHIDPIDFADGIRDEINTSTPVSKAMTLNLIEKVIKACVEKVFPAELKPMIESGLWEIVSMDMKKLSLEQQEKLLLYLRFKCFPSQKHLKPFIDLLSDLQKEINSKKQVSIDDSKENARNMVGASQSGWFSASGSNDSKSSNPNTGRNNFSLGLG